MTTESASLCVYSHVCVFEWVSDVHFSMFHTLKKIIYLNFSTFTFIAFTGTLTSAFLRRFTGILFSIET